MTELLSWYVAIPTLGIVAIGIWKWSQNSAPKQPSKPIIPTSPIRKPKDKAKSNEEAIANGLIPVKIFYGSQTGTAEDFSHKLASEAKRYKFHPTVLDLEGYETDELKNEGFAIFLVATYGEGEPTDNAREFSEWLQDESHENDKLKGLKFSVFGLGNKTYEHYNAMGRLF